MTTRKRKSGIVPPGLTRDIRLMGWKRKRVMVPSSSTPGIKFKRRMEQGGELLPGMLDDITLWHICTKLSLRDIHVLSSVSTGWQQALQSRQIYDSRVDSNSTETLVVMPRILLKCFMIPNISFSLCSFRDKYVCKLPPFPLNNTVWTKAPGFLSLDRKIYILGGRPGTIPELVFGEADSFVYMLDLIERQWKQCGDMIERRRTDFAAAPLNGKIYVFGGLGSPDRFSKSFSTLSTCEVYDPKTDAWSFIKPMPSSRFCHQVAIMGDELFLYGGQTWSGSTFDPGGSATYLDIYHPVKDEWRRIVPSENFEWDHVFTARGNFHRVKPPEIQVYDIDKDAWRVLHTFQDVPRRWNRPIVIGDELFIELYRKRQPKDEFFKSNGFGSKNTAITFKIVGNFPSCTDSWIPVQL